MWWVGDPIGTHSGQGISLISTGQASRTSPLVNQLGHLHWQHNWDVSTGQTTGHLHWSNDRTSTTGHLHWLRDWNISDERTTGASLQRSLNEEEISSGQATRTSPHVKQSGHPVILHRSNNQGVSTGQTAGILHWSNNQDISPGQTTGTSPLVKQPGDLQWSNDQKPLRRGQPRKWPSLQEVAAGGRRQTLCRDASAAGAGLQAL